jgi:hypothetical protein
MHMKIGVITYSDTKADADDDAEIILDRLIPQPFDYFTILGTYRADSKQGKELIETRIEYTWTGFKDTLKKIRLILATMTDEEIFEQRMEKSSAGDGSPDFLPSLVRYYFYQIGQYQGSETWLYDNDGEGIRNREHLKNVLDKWEEALKESQRPNPYTDLNIWVTIADVHY